MFISNPRSRELDEFAFGIESIPDLIGASEDVRRFDIAIAVSSNQIKRDLMEEGTKKVPHEFTSELCRSLVLFAWTRTTDQVQFDADAVHLIKDKAIQLQKRYTDAMKLVDQGTTVHKVARLAAALAARTFSVDDKDPHVLRVRACHVYVVLRLLYRLYDDPVMGYKQYTDHKKDQDTVRHPKAVDKYIRDLPHPEAFAQCCLSSPSVTMDDLAAWTSSCSRDEIGRHWSYFVLERCFFRPPKSRYYQKSVAFMKLLTQLLNNGLPEDIGLENEEV